APYARNHLLGGLEAPEEVGRAVQMVMGVGGDVVHEAVVQELERELADRRPEAAREGRRRDRAEHAAVHEPGQARRVALEDRTALRARKNGAEPAGLDVPQDPLKVDVDRAAGALHEEAVP